MPQMTASEQIIHLENVTKDFRSLRALEDVTLDVGPGITGLLGPNGAGKTTLIKVLLGLLTATSGQGHVLGFPLGKGARSIRARVGYMPEDDCYVEGLAGVEMVRLGWSPVSTRHGVGKYARELRAAEAESIAARRGIWSRNVR